MVATPDMSYPAPLQRDDRLRGRLDGEQRIPSLAEVRRREQELAETGGQLTVGYQVVLLAELSQKLNELHVAYLRMGQALALELSRCDERIERAQEDLRRMQEGLRDASVPLTPEELRPRNSEEVLWAEEVLRHRREVARSRRVLRARENVDHARDRVERRQAERAAAVRQHQEAASGPGIQAQRTVELYQRRIAVYLAALAQNHPEGGTLYPLLTLPSIPLPGWVTESSPHHHDTRSLT
ncbi:hypothetical protein ACIBD9_04005 [Micromonospora sp. NPDC050784]|uniref:hypothetical protein n=1 Tax=Micromonospora sp. NPDC050784 TaxID=3364281 RepID=UPI0037B3C624